MQKSKLVGRALRLAFAANETLTPASLRKQGSIPRSDLRALSYGPLLSQGREG